MGAEWPGQGDSNGGADGAAVLAEQEQGRQRSGCVRRLVWVLGLAVVGVAAYAVWQMWLAWQTGYELDWQHAKIAGGVLIFLALAYVAAGPLGRFLLGLRPLVQRVRAQTNRMSQAAIARDERLAPLAAEQPEPLPSTELPFGPTSFGPFGTERRKERRRSVVSEVVMALTAGGVLAFFIGLNTVLNATVPGTSDGPFGGMLTPFFAVFEGILALFILMSLATLGITLWGRVASRRRDLPERFTADDWGIRQDVGGRRTAGQPLAWHEVRAFYKADDLLRLAGSVVSEGPPQRTTYTVDSGERRLRWSVGTASPPDKRAESERLARLVVTRTRLPLRDVSAAATTQALAILDLVMPVVDILGDRRLTLQTATASPPARPASRTIGSHPSRRTIASRVGAIGLAVVLLGMGGGAQTLQSFQYTDLIDQHITYEQPYYTIDFREDDGRWPKHAATATDGSYVFASDGYHVTGAPDGQPMQAVLSDTFGDATLELTAGLAGSTPASDYGMVLRETGDGSAKVVFSVSSTGGWALTSYATDASGVTHRMLLMGNEHSGAVQTGQDTSNSMTVIMRGGDYICLVRDHLVGIYHDDAGQTPHQGHSGIWLGNSQATGIYYYFSVYPAQ